MDVSWETSAFLSRISSLPQGLLDSISQPRNNAEFLNTLSAVALIPEFTHAIFAHFQRLGLELCARWTSQQHVAAVAAFGRVLPGIPHLSELAQRILSGDNMSSDLLQSLELSNLENDISRQILLGVFRLLKFDNAGFARLLRPAKLQLFLRHDDRSIRYLTVRILCLYLHASDNAMEEMLLKYLGSEPIDGPWEDKVIDYTFLTLWEEKRLKDFASDLEAVRTRHFSHTWDQNFTRVIRPSDLSPAIAEICGVLLLGSEKHQEQQAISNPIIFTDSMTSNAQRTAEAFLRGNPVLLTGHTGAGKTHLVRYIANALDKSSSMVTLHLNEQSDAKLLLGIYTTTDQPGSFKWQPGVLTTAVREGRWVFIEDLDRAPNEVISTILPLIERNELVIPGRNESIQAAHGFKIIATMRSQINLSGEEVVPISRMLGSRLWTKVQIVAPTTEELQRIVIEKYPVLKVSAPRTISVFNRLRQEMTSIRHTSFRRRPVSSRELLKWAGRINDLFARSGIRTGKESVPEQVLDEMFLDAVDCFASSIEEDEPRRLVSYWIAEELHLDRKRAQHLLEDRTIQHKLKQEQHGDILVVGRASLPRLTRTPGNAKPAMPFAMNRYSLRLLEQVSVAAQRREPLLLVGETGIGKTTAVQHLARSLGHRLLAINLSQQSESSDLLGGFKPVNTRSLIMPLKDQFDNLFEESFSQKKNQRFIELMNQSVAKGQWKRVIKLWREALNMVEKALQSSPKPQPENSNGAVEQSTKRRKLTRSRPLPDRGKWEAFAHRIDPLEHRLSASSSAFAFSFMEGRLVKAVRDGQWVLLDEINLATPDTLECLSDLLEGGPDSRPFLLLTETASVERIEAHPNFRIFGAMNPATDVGKKELPLGIRSRFTEVFVTSPDRDLESLQNIVETYLEGLATQTDRKLAVVISELYLEIQTFVRNAEIVDGSNQMPHFSLRSLTRALTHARAVAHQCGLKRAVYEGFSMCFLTCLSGDSEQKIQKVIRPKLFGDGRTAKAELKRPLRRPDNGKEYVQVTLRVQQLEKGKASREESHWLPKGQEPIEDSDHYIVTPFIRRNLENLIRAVSSQKYPVLIQGPTSAGKTSMVEYLAKRSGNKFVRINNHEHTDLQEYLGTYVSTSDGQLVFQEGVLNQALREGHWVVLDELNLAPTDVLEALNRLLDDNRELLIPETQEIVRPHPGFVLFATQNPSGPYGGRKVLSRAFRNRFLELQFDDIPVEELNIILSRRSNLPESWCGKIVEVYKRLSQLRQENRLFEQHSFATLRDLFRWAFRGADSVEQLAANGYMLLAEKVRKPEERANVKEVIETVMSGKGVKVAVDDFTLYNADPCMEASRYDAVGGGKITWTKAMRRLFVLVSSAIRYNEPVLLVGETGCGKTTVCQMLSEALEKQLHIVNAHQNTETGDLIGAQRPVRNRVAVDEQLTLDLQASLQNKGFEHIYSMNVDGLLSTYDSLSEEQMSEVSIEHAQRIKKNRTSRKALFEWQDGSIVQAMRAGDFYLLDEISLADDSVLERLNSVLDPQRSLLLAEKGSIDALVVANDGFQFFATMNPGGDFGKKELSPALRNRFTEIWVPPLSDGDDVLEIVRAKLATSLKEYAGTVVDFAKWFGERYQSLKASSISIRDVLAWVDFVNAQDLPPLDAVLHGAAMVFIDTLGANPSALVSRHGNNIDAEKTACLKHLGLLLGCDVSQVYLSPVQLQRTEHTFQAGCFRLHVLHDELEDTTFDFQASTTKLNTMRVVRALQVPKPILLEGNPGVGKTTIITAIANAIGKPLTRINLSEQTDLMDLFGSDAPVEDGEAGQFSWRDAPFLSAMKRGDWVLLDEMNLASQSVLEGLNACLDHRGEAYISELDQIFKRHPEFRLFAAQNPHHQGSGRKGLPSSFTNRFTVVYADTFKQDDLMSICTRLFPDLDRNLIETAVNFVVQLDRQVTNRHGFGASGSPWEFNLRDTIRWLQLLSSRDAFLPAGNARDFFDCLFVQRFRSVADVRVIERLFETTFSKPLESRNIYANMSPGSLQVGLGILQRSTHLQVSKDPWQIDLKPNLATLESLILCVQQNWPVILVGSSGVGKTHLLRSLASLTGAELEIFPMSSDIDATDLVGGYEQVDPARQIQAFLKDLEHFTRCSISKILSGAMPDELSLSLFDALRMMTEADQSSIELSSVREVLWKLAARTQTPEAKAIASKCDQMVSLPKRIESARFEWVDGTLIKAIEHGKWLILDNANLCSSSVLDRLNSLLEPNGYLIVNEHCSENGTAKVVKPHPSFRIFLTMDPKYGEVSRAMRNRSVELFVTGRYAYTGDLAANSSFKISPESKMMRFRQFLSLCNNVQEHKLSEKIIEAGIGSISLSDSNIFQKFVQQVQVGLLPLELTTVHPVLERVGLSLSLENWLDPTRKLYYTVASCFSEFKEFVNTQSIQPLCNEALVALNRVSTSTHDPFWLNNIYTLVLTLAEMEQRLRIAHKDAEYGKATTLLRRSFIEYNETKSRPDSSAHAATYLMCTQNMLVESVKARVRDGPSPQDTVDFQLIKHIRTFWWEILACIDASHYDEAMFQAYLLFEERRLAALASFDISETLLLTTQSHVKRLRSFAELTTGQSMERLWSRFRSRNTKSFVQLQSLIKLETVANNFDDLLWRIDTPTHKTLELRRGLVRALDLTRSQEVNVDALTLEMKDSLKLLQPEEEVQPKQPFFQPVFEGICQILDLFLASNTESLECHDAEISMSMFAMRRTQSQFASDHSNTNALMLSRLVNYMGLAGHGNTALALNGQIHSLVLMKLSHMHEISLDKLDLLESEFPVLGRAFAAQTNIITGDQLTCLQMLLRRLMFEVLQAHQDVVELNVPGILRKFLTTNDPQTIRSEAIKLQGQKHLLVLSQTASTGDQVRSIIEHDLNLALQNLAQSYTSDTPQMFLASAFKNFSYACLILYVPDRMFDPALSAVAAERLFQRQRNDLASQLEAQIQTERFSTNNTSNLRCKVIQHQLEELGEEPLPAHVPRPPTSQLRQLQNEFDALLTLVNRNDSAATTEEATSDAIVNGLQIVGRLRDDHRVYEDLTSPAIGFLQCQIIGLSLQQETRAISESLNTTVFLLKKTPFLSSLKELRSISSPANVQGNDIFHEHALISHCLHSSVETPAKWTEAKLENVEVSFQFFYLRWKQQLEIDRQKEQASSSIYHYKGDQDDSIDEDAEFDALFPDFEPSATSDDHGQPLTQNQRATAVKIADFHMGIFLGSNVSTSTTFLKLLEFVGVNIGRSHDPSRGAVIGASIAEVLPTIFLQIATQRKYLTEPKASGVYNVYREPNLPELRKIITLVKKIQQQFRSLQAVWPEHATLQDVLEICRDILTFKIVDPVMLVLTKAEKLHAFIAEWQKVASRDYSAQDSLDTLTDLLVNWRRLELSTWSQLLDMESRNCEDDAKSWWFVLYENVGLGISGAGVGVVDILQTLQEFLTSSTLGQFNIKLRMLRSLAAQQSTLDKHSMTTQPISGPLDNLLSYYSRYSLSVTENIAKKRQGLEKDLKDVIKLASWNDRNVESLKQSAQSSHRKLFRIVRKFRDALNQPVQQFLKEVDSATLDRVVQDVRRPLRTTPDIPTVALEVCQKLPAWVQRPARFQSIGSTSTRLYGLASLPPTYESQHSRLDDFVDSLNASLEELRKATPSALSKENAPLVKHLTTRKRKLLADTLKSVRQMGISSNLSSAELARQDSHAKIFANVPAFPTALDLPDAYTAERSLQRSMDLMSDVRRALKKHNEEINPAEIGRSVGFLEGLLSLSLKQRTNLVNSAKNLQELNVVVERISTLWADDGPAVQVADKEKLSSLKNTRQTVMWLPSIIDITVKVLEAQAELGNLDFSTLLSDLRQWSVTFASIRIELTQQHHNPEGLVSNKQFEQVHAAGEELSRFRNEIVDYLSQNPHARVVLQRIVPWTEVSTNHVNTKVNGAEKPQFEDTSTKIFSAMDLVLGSVQDVQAIIRTLPDVDEESNWLTKQDSALVSALSAFHAPTIIDAFGGLLETLTHFPPDYSQSFSSFSALLALSRPVLEQYRHAYHDCVAHYASIHNSTCHVLHQLSKNFCRIATDGFCTPKEQSNEKVGDSEKLESGTGLGEGDGAEDISKDIGDDEDLSELAQDQQNREQEGEIEDQEDAVNIEDNLEGGKGDGMAEQETNESDDGDDVNDQEEMGGDDEQNTMMDEGGGEGCEGEEDVKDEGMGDVNDQEPSAVDEKMWDNPEDTPQEDKQGDQSTSTKNENEQAATMEKKNKKEQGLGEDGDASEIESAASEDVDDLEDAKEEEGGLGDTDSMDPHLKESEGLDLPEDLKLDEDPASDKDKPGDESDEDMLDDIDGAEEEKADNAGNKAELDEVSEEAGELGEADEIDKEDKQDQEQDQSNPIDSEMTAGGVDDAQDAEQVSGAGQAGVDANDDQQENSLDIEVQGEGAEQQQENQEASSNRAQRQTGSRSEAENTRTEDAQGKPNAEPGREQDQQESKDAMAVRKLGNILEKWHKQQRDIQESSAENLNRDQLQEDADMADADFEHLPDEDTQADTQAMGLSTQDQAHAVDDSMAVEETTVGEQEPQDMPSVAQESDEEQDEDTQMDASDAAMHDQNAADMQSQPNALVGDPKTTHPPSVVDSPQAPPEEDDANSETTSIQDDFSTLQLTNPLPPTKRRDAHSVWSYYLSLIHTASLHLTEQLRLILEPTRATKLSGAFRTGKRLNIKRIIPYIASSYKRDKIWLRRSLPQKRDYQIILAIDDSRSMDPYGIALGGATTGDTTNGHTPEDHDQHSPAALAFQTLALLSSSLHALDSGSLAVLAFGSNTITAHSLTTPWSPAAGGSVLSQFTFSQTSTDVVAMVDRAVESFSDAKNQSIGNETWQICMVVGDGVFGEHDTVRRHVVQAKEERIMFVFVIVDAMHSGSTKGVSSGGKGKGKESKQSIMDLETVEFVENKGEGGEEDSVGVPQIKRTKYLDTFPFEFYLIVRDVAELPGVLATALRQWFGEIGGVM